MPEMAEENKPGGDLNDIRTQTDDLLKSLDSLDKAPKSSTKPSSGGSTQKSSSSSVKTILVAAGCLAGIAVVIIGGLLALEASKQATLKLAKQQAIRDQAVLDKEKVDREKEAREQDKREREAREQKETERLSSLRQELLAKGWEEIGTSGLLHRYCNPGNNKSSLGDTCSNPDSSQVWFGVEFYCLSASCSGIVEGGFGGGGSDWTVKTVVSRGYVALAPRERRILLFSQKNSFPGSWLTQAAGFCRNNSYLWEKC